MSTAQPHPVPPAPLRSGQSEPVPPSCLYPRLTKVIALTSIVLLSGCQMALFSPKGDIGTQGKIIILLALGLMLLIIIPIALLTLYVAWLYREGNTKAVHAPKWLRSRHIGVIVWSVPCIIVGFLALLIWDTRHSLDPYKSITSKQAPVTVEVVALNWKWLFIYPDYGVASVNQLTIPVDTPIAFKLTAASIMHSFFIPQLGSQVDAMAGMQTQLHLIADTPGVYHGLSTADSGAGFSDMSFETRAVSRAEFDTWIKDTASTPKRLDTATYLALEKPSVKEPAALYASVEPGLFEGIVNKHMPEDPSMQMPFLLAPSAVIDMLRRPAPSKE